MKVYLAAKFGEKNEMRDWARMIEDAGHQVVSSWLDEKHDSDAEASEEVMIAAAKQNMLDVLEADVLVTKSQAQGTAHTGGGRHFEFGFAVAEGIDVIVVGPKGEHVFHYLEGIHHVNNLDGLFPVLARMQSGFDQFNALVAR